MTLIAKWLLDLIAPYLFRLALAGGIAAACAAGWWGLSIHYENIGWAKAIHAVAAKDERALNAVHEATAKVDECYSSGRTWNTVDGMCD